MIFSKRKLIERFFIVAAMTVITFSHVCAEDKNAINRSAARQMIAAALAEIPKIGDVEVQASAYIDVARIQIKVEDTAGALKNLILAQETATKITAAEKQVQIQHDLITAFAQAGAFDEANALAAKIPDKNKDEYRAYLAILEAQAKAGKIHAARETIDKIESDLAKATAYGMIAQAQFKEKDAVGGRASLDLARKSLERSKTPIYYQPFAVMKIVRIYAEAGEFAEAQNTLTQFEDLSKLTEAIAYRSIATNQAKRNDFPAAMKTVAIMKSLVANTRNDDSKPFVVLELQNTFAEIAEEQAKAGDAAGAKATALQISNKCIRSMAYLKIASQQSKKGQVEDARQSIELATEQTRKIPEDSMKILCYLAIAGTQAEIGDEKAARDSVEAAINSAEGIERERAYRQIIWTLAWYCHDVPGAKALVAHISDKEYRSDAYQGIAAEQARAGDVRGAIEYLVGAEADPYKRCQNLTKAAEILCTDE